MSRGDYSAAATKLGASYTRDAAVLVAAKPQVVIFCTSIMSLATVLKAFPLADLADTLVVDVLSVKVHAATLLTELLPADADILCTHPMFGPESGRAGWGGLPFVYDRLRVRDGPRCDRFLAVWAAEGCRMVEMSVSTHDAYAASTQFITHTTGRLLAGLGVGGTPINTKGYESLLRVVDTTISTCVWREGGEGGGGVGGGGMGGGVGVGVWGAFWTSGGTRTRHTYGCSLRACVRGVRAAAGVGAWHPCDY